MAIKLKISTLDIYGTLKLPSIYTADIEFHTYSNLADAGVQHNDSLTNNSNTL